MERTLTQQDIDSVKHALRNALASKLESPSQQKDELALGGDFISILIEQIIFPILLSLVASGLYDAIKKTLRDALEENEPEKAAQKLVGNKIDTEKPLESESLEELKVHLYPLGFNIVEIIEVYEKAKSSLQETEHKK